MHLSRLRPVILAAVAALSPAVHAADRPIRGRALVVSDPTPLDPSRRTIRFSARQDDGTPLTGDPTTPANSSGAVLQLQLDGGTPTAQTFVLGQGTTSRGRSLWRALSPAGFAYADPDGAHGPVQKLRLRRGADDKVTIKGTLRGDALDLVPPNPGTQGYVLLTVGDGDRYCVRFGPDAAVQNQDSRRFRVGRVQSSGCPASVTGEVLALSYNVAGLPEGLSGSHPAVNTAQIAPLLNGYELVLMQETWKTPDPNPLAPLRVYHEILEAGSTHPFKSLSAPLPLQMDPRRPSAFVADGLNQFSRYPFGQITREMWTVCHPSAADCLALKGFTMTRTTFAPGVVVDVYDLHNEAGSEPQDDVVRDLDVTQLSTFIQTISAGRPVIVGGDFNLHTNDEPDSTQFQRLLAETGLSDVCATLTCPSPGRIDKFLFRSSDAVTIAPLTWHFESDVFVDGMGEQLSDHEALAVRFQWTVTTPP